MWDLIFLVPFCKFGLFRMGFWQNVHVEAGPAAAVYVGRVRLREHGKKTAVQISHKLLSQQPEGNTPTQRKAEEPRCSYSALGSGSHTRSQCHPSHSLPDNSTSFSSLAPEHTCDTPQVKWKLLVSNLGWKKQSYPSLCTIQASSIITKMLPWENICRLSVN